MVDHLRAPVTSLVQPGEMVRRVRPAVNGDSPVASFIQFPSDVAGSNHTTAPSKFSGLGIVIQKGAQPRASHSPRSSHDDLAK